MVDDDDQVTVSTFVGDLVDPDPPQALEPVDRLVDVGVDAGHDRADCAPRDAQEFHHCAFRCANRKPCRERIEVASVTGPVTRPRHRRDDHPMFAATHSRRPGFEEHARRAQVQRSPPTPSFAVVIAR